MTKDRAVARHIRNLIRDRAPGDRLPTVRHFMERLGVSQLIVQRALHRLREEGLLVAHVGRGTFVANGEDHESGPAPVGRRRSGLGARARSVLMLTRNAGSARTAWVGSLLQERLATQGIQSLQITYSDVDHAMEAQRDLSGFSACVLQTHFEFVPVKLLSFVRERSDAILVDGATITGVDVDSVASDWRSAIEVAMRHLHEQGHKRIAFATSSDKARPIDATHQHFESLRRWAHDEEVMPPTILMDFLPGEANGRNLADQLRAYRSEDGGFAFSALIIWGIVRGGELLDAFAELGIRVPNDLSVVTLGHVDIEMEHRNFFTMAGSSAAETVDRLLARIERRWDDESAGYEPDYLPVHLVRRLSVKPHPKAPV